MWGYHYWDGGMGFGGMFLSLLFWFMVIYGLVSLFQCGKKGSSSECKHKETPMDVLKRRYAAGEIKEEEYQRMKKELQT